MGTRRPLVPSHPDASFRMGEAALFDMREAGEMLASDLAHLTPTSLPDRHGMT